MRQHRPFQDGEGDRAVIHRFRQFARLLLHVDDSPHRTALAFSIGIFIAFFPLIGVHTAMALAIAFFFRLNRVALLLGAYVNNPWTLAPMFTGGTLLGCFMMGVPPDSLWAIGEGEAQGSLIAKLIYGIRHLGWPFVLGNVALGLIAAILSYGMVYWLLVRHNQKRTVVNVIETAPTTDPSRVS
jgi:uncharacterized protein (DUF2062 family)